MGMFWRRSQVQIVSKVIESKRIVGGAIRSLVNARSLQLNFAKVLHETLLVPVLLYGI